MGPPHGDGFRPWIARAVIRRGKLGGGIRGNLENLTSCDLGFLIGMSVLPGEKHRVLQVLGLWVLRKETDKHHSLMTIMLICTENV